MVTEEQIKEMENNILFKIVRTYKINGHKVEFSIEKDNPAKDIPEDEKIGTIIGLYVDGEGYDGNEITDESDETIDSEVRDYFENGEIWFLTEITEQELAEWVKSHL